MSETGRCFNCMLVFDREKLEDVNGDGILYCADCKEEATHA